MPQQPMQSPSDPRWTPAWSPDALDDAWCEAMESWAYHEAERLTGISPDLLEMWFRCINCPPWSAVDSFLIQRINAWCWSPTLMIVEDLFRLDARLYRSRFAKGWLSIKPHRLLERK